MNTPVIWAAQDPRSPTCDYCGELRQTYRGLWLECRCEARRAANREASDGNL